jgi:hypothetical protein
MPIPMRGINIWHPNRASSCGFKEIATRDAGRPNGGEIGIGPRFKPTDMNSRHSHTSI